MNTVALALAGLAALGYGTASVLQAMAARDTTLTAGVRTGPSVATMTAPLYLIGTGLDLLAWLASLAALRTLPVFEVQAVLAASLAVTAVLARLVLGTTPGRAGWAGVTVAALAVGVLAASAGPQQQAGPGGTVALLLAAAALPVALAGFAAARAGRALPCGALAGLAFGGAALCARAIRVPAGAGPGFALLGSLAAQPLTWGLLLFGLTGMLLYAHALERGDAARVTALLWITEVAVPSVVGVAVLGDAVRAGWWAPAVLAVTGCLVASWLLAYSGAVTSESTPTAPTAPATGAVVPVARE